MAELTLRLDAEDIGIQTLTAAVDGLVTRIIALENKVGTLAENVQALTGTIDRLNTRIAEDFDARTAERDAARAEVVRLGGLLEEARLADAADEAEHARLAAEVQAALDRIDAQDPIPPVPEPEPLPEPPDEG